MTHLMDEVQNNSCVYCDIPSLETCRLKRRLERVHSIMQYTQITIFFEVYWAYLKMEMKCILVKISHTEFKKICLKGLWGTWEIPFMSLCKLGIIMKKYRWKLKLPHTWLTPPISNSNMWTGYGASGKFHLELYVNQALLWICMAANQNRFTNVSKNLPYQIWSKTIWQYWRYC
jgi:hypothetical protein